MLLDDVYENAYVVVAVKIVEEDAVVVGKDIEEKAVFVEVVGELVANIEDGEEEVFVAGAVAEDEAVPFAVDG